jgi:type IV secretion system protein VirB4
MLRKFSQIQTDMIVVTEWQPWDSARASAALRSKRRHFHNTKIGISSQIDSERPAARELMVDDSKEAQVDELGRCLTEMQMDNVQLGEFSLTVLLFGNSLDTVERACADVAGVVGTHDGVINEETYNGLNVFAAALPGGYLMNIRRMLVTNKNYVDMNPWFLPSQGKPRNNFLNAPALMAFETEDKSLFNFNLHVEDVGHTVVLGSTGAGKSFLLNVLILHAQKYRPHTIVLDCGNSYGSLAEAIGGSCLTFRPERNTVSLNPLALEPTQENLEFQVLFVKLLIEKVGHQVTADESQDLFDSIRSLAALDRKQRRLKTLATTVGRSIGRYLKLWTEGEQYGPWFDNVEDTLSYKHFQYLDVEGMDRIGLALEPLILYLFQRVNETISAPRLSAELKLMVVDEAWLFLTHPLTRGYVETALRTWRKKNAAIVLATHSLRDLTGTDIMAPIIDNCQTKILLANPTLDAKFYGEVLRLTPPEQEKVRGLVSKRQFLLKREGLSKVLNLNVDPRSYWLFTTNPFEAKRRQEAMTHGGLDAALDILTGGSQ